MLLQTNSYIVPKERRAEHARLMRRFRQVLGRLGCEGFEVHEQVGANWSGGETSGRFVQLMRFRDRKHHAALQAAERTDPDAQQLIAEFCELVNFQYQQQQGFFAVGFYTSVLSAASGKAREEPEQLEEAAPPEATAVQAPAEPPDPFSGAETQIAETQTYAAEELATSESPGHLTESSEPMESPAVEALEPLEEQQVTAEAMAEGTHVDVAEPTEPPTEAPMPEPAEQQPPRRSSLFGRRKQV